MIIFLRTALSIVIGWMGYMVMRIPSLDMNHNINAVFAGFLIGLLAFLALVGEERHDRL